MKQTQTYPPGMIIFPNDQMEKYKEYMEKTKGMSQRQIFSELMKAKEGVNKEVLNKHIKNLDALAQTEGFFSENHKARIPLVKQMLLAENVAPGSSTPKEANVESQYLWGFGSSWLWWLLLASIWGGGYWGGYYGYPYYY